MTAVVKNIDITNTTGALLTSVPTEIGKERSVETIQWTFSAADVGTGAGQTRDATNPNPTGFLFAQFKGATVKAIFAPSLIKTAAVNGTNFDGYIYGTTTNIAKLSFRIDNSVAGVSSIYLLDQGTGTGSSIIQAGDKVNCLVELGNT